MGVFSLQVIFFLIPLLTSSSHREVANGHNLEGEPCPGSLHSPRHPTSLRGATGPRRLGACLPAPASVRGRGQRRLRVSPGGPRATPLGFELHLLPRPPGPRGSRPSCLGVTALPTSGPHTSFREEEPFSVGDTVQGPNLATNAGRSVTSGRLTQVKKQRRRRLRQPRARRNQPQPGPGSRARLWMTSWTRSVTSSHWPGPAVTVTQSNATQGVFGSFLVS